MSSWKTPLSSGKDPSKLDANNARPGVDRGHSAVSKLSSDEDDEEGGESESEMLVCGKCEGKDFRAKRVSGKGLVMVCLKCGRNVDEK